MGHGPEQELARRIGARIRALRAARGWSQVDLEAHLDRQVKRASLSDFETGRRIPSVRTLIAMASAFEVDLATMTLSPRDPRHKVAEAVLTCDDTTLIHVAKLLDVDLDKRGA